MTISNWNDVFSGDGNTQSPQRRLAPGVHYDTYNGRMVIYAGVDIEGVTLTPEEEEESYDMDDDNFTLTMNGRPYYSGCSCPVCSHREEQDQNRRRSWDPRRRYASMMFEGPSWDTIDEEAILEELESATSTDDSTGDEEDGEDDDSSFRSWFRSIVGL